MFPLCAFVSFVVNALECLDHKGHKGHEGVRSRKILVKDIQGYNLLVPVLHNLRVTLEMIKWEHSIFMLPFALCGAMLAAQRPA